MPNVALSRPELVISIVAAPNNDPALGQFAQAARRKIELAHGGRQATDKWTNAFSGQLLAPTAPERRFAQPSPSQVFVGR
jgi:hypothetical protein